MISTVTDKNNREREEGGTAFVPSRRTIRLSICFATKMYLGLFPQSVFAEDTSEPLYTTVVIDKRPNAAGTESQIDEAEIALRGARNLPDALVVEPSVEVNRSPKAGATLQIRGFDEKSILLLFEGIPIREVYDGHFDIASLPVFSFESIIMEKGVTSLLDGPNSAGGVLRLKAPATCNDTAQVEIFGRPALREESAMYGGRAKACARFSDVTLSAGVGYETSEGYPLSNSYEETKHNAQYHEEGDTRDGSDYKKTSLSFVGKYAPAPHKGLTQFVDAIQSPRSVPPFEGYGYTRYWRFVDYNTLLLGASGTYGPSVSPSAFGLREVNGMVYAHVHRDELRDYEDVTYGRLTTNTLAWFVASGYANETVGASLKGTWALNRGNSLDLSLRYNFDRHRQREIPVPKEGDAMTWTSWEHYLSHTFTASMEDTQVLGKWRLGAGFATSGMSLIAQEIRHSSYPVDRRLIPAYEGRVFADYAPIEGLRLTAAAGHKVRLPVLKELFSNSIGGNPNLNSERAWMAEVGFDSEGVLLRDLDTSVRLFGNGIRDLIDKYRDVYANIGRAVIAGVEVEARYTPIRLLQFHAGYRYLYTRDLDTDKPLDYRTPHRAVIGERLRFRLGITIAIEAVINSGQRAYYVDAKSGDWVEDRLSPYALMNAHIRYSHRMQGNSEVYLYIDAFNLADANYCVGSFEPRPGRELVIGIGSRF